MTYVSEWCRDRIAPALSPATPRNGWPGCRPEWTRPASTPAAGGARRADAAGSRPAAPVVVCTARLVRRKGQDTLVRAWPRGAAGRPGAVLLLVGDGPDRPRLERLAGEAGH